MKNISYFVLIVLVSCIPKKVKYTKIVDNVYLKKKKDKECIVIKNENISNCDLTHLLVKRESVNNGNVKIKLIDSIQVNNRRYEISSIIKFDKVHLKNKSNSLIELMPDNLEDLNVRINNSQIEFNFIDTFGLAIIFKDITVNNKYNHILPHIKIPIYEEGNYELYIFPIYFNECETVHIPRSGNIPNYT